MNFVYSNFTNILFLNKLRVPKKMQKLHYFFLLISIRFKLRSYFVNGKLTNMVTTF